MRRTRPLAVSAAAALAAIGFSTAPVAAAPRSTQLTHSVLSHSVPTWTKTARSTGVVAARGWSTFRVYLAPKTGVESLKADVASVSDPSSPNYQKFLSAAQFHARYDATLAQSNQVSDWLSAEGLTVTAVEAHRRYLTVSGSNATIQRVFATTLKSFRHRGVAVQANTTALSVPKAVAPLILTVTGLDTTPRRITHQAQPAGFRNARPCSKTYGQLPANRQADYKTPLPKFKGKTLPYAVCGYTGPLLRSAYLDGSELDGSGTTVAITDAYASPTIAADANNYAGRNGDGSYVAGQLAQRVPATFRYQEECDATGWYGEETLDVEAVHAIAPGAKIVYYGSASCYEKDFLQTLTRVVDDNKASLVTNSWSDLEANENPDTVAAYEQIFLQGAMQGVGFTFSTGDSGDELSSTGLRQANYPASDPYVTAVGGTSDAIGANGAFVFQTGWGTEKYTLAGGGKNWTPNGFLYGAGGGNSTLFNRPSYQNGIVPGSNGSGRGVPDVAMDGDPTTGMLVGLTQTFSDGTYYDEYRIGGTSLASPLFAGMTALRQQSAGKRQGFLNPAIYAHRAAFNDITGSPKDAGNVRVDFKNGENTVDGLTYTVRTFNEDSSLAVAPGWDDVTGVGSPTPAWLTQK